MGIEEMEVGGEMLGNYIPTFIMKATLLKIFLNFSPLPLSFA